MAASSRKEELLAAIEEMCEAGMRLTEDVVDEVVAHRAIFKLSQKIAYLSQTQVEWAQRIVTQPALNCALRVAIEAKWFHALTDGTPQTAVNIAEATGTYASLLSRMMRILASEGLVDEVGVETYAANDQTRYFMVAEHEDMAKTWFDNVSGPMVKLPEYLVNTKFCEPHEDSVGPYAFTYGMTSWDRFVKQPAIGESFNRAMTVVKRHGRCPLVEKYPLVSRLHDKLPLDHDDVLIVDIAGGLGFHLRQFREDEPSQPSGRLILQDQPHVLPSLTHEPEIADLLATARIETMEYDFFTPQPIQGALIYHFSAILHNWPDEDCLRILYAQLPSLRPYHSRLLVHDYVLPDTEASTMQAGFDLSMMAVLCGKERSLKEWKILLAKIGLGVVGVWADGCVNELDHAQGSGGFAGGKLGVAGGTRIIECDFLFVIEKGGYEGEEVLVERNGNVPGYGNGCDGYVN